MLKFKADQPIAGNALLSRIRDRSGVRVHACYQCGKCSAGCPVAQFMDLMPRQIMRAIQLGQTDLVLRSSTIWLCASCHTCSVRCPMEIDVARVMDCLRQIARTERIPPAERSVVLGHEMFLESVKRLGRLYEVGLVAGLNLGTLKPFANVSDVGLPLFVRGKLNLLPTRAGGVDLKRIFAEKKRDR